MRRLNNRGYLIVELILASVLAMTVAYFLLNLVVKMSSKNQDLYVETALLTDKAIMTNLVMEDVNKYTLVGVRDSSNGDDKGFILEFSKSSTSEDTFKTKALITTKNGKKIFRYGKLDDSDKYIESEVIEKELNSNIVSADTDINMGDNKLGNSVNNSVLIINNSLKTLYSDTNYGLNLRIIYNNRGLKFKPSISVKGEYSGGVNFEVDATRNKSVIEYFDVFPSNSSHKCWYNKNGTKKDISNVSELDNVIADTDIYCQAIYGELKSDEESVKVHIIPKPSTEIELKCDNFTVNEGVPDFNEVATREEGLYKTNKGDCYYRGASNSNYLKFAGAMFRIIRYNSNGTIRIITDGTIGNSVFNSLNNHNAFVGYMIPSTIYRDNLVTYEETHKNEKKSNIKSKIDAWFGDFITYETSKQIDNSAIYCNDRSTGNGSTKTSCRGAWFPCYYAGYERLFVNSMPSLSCGSNDDFVQVGTITADEVVMAGGVYGKVNTSYYLYNGGYSFWTMTPFSFTNCGASLFMVNDRGSLNVNVSGSTGTGVSCSANSNNSYGVRPVITLKSGLKFKGNGTKDNPYVISE